MIDRVVPRAAPPRSVALPRAHEMRLTNGMRVIAVSRAEVPTRIRVPLVAATLSIDRGSANDPPELPGLAAMTSALLRQGTRRRTALELDMAIDALGARLDRGSSYDASSLGVSATTDVFPQALSFLAETLREPTFAQDEFERLRARALSDLRLAYGSPSSLARLVVNRVVAGDSPYAHPIAGTPRSLEALTRDDVVAFHAHAYRPEHATLLIGGEIGVEEAFALAESTFGDWRTDPFPPRELPERPQPAPRRRVVVVDKPDAGRTAVAVARAAIARGSRDYYPGIVTCAVLSGYSGRLNAEVRVKRGLSYGAGAQLLARRASGQFVAATLVDHTRALETIDVILATLASLEVAPVADAELVARKASLVGGFNRTIDTNDGLLAVLSDYALYGIGLDELERYVRYVEAVGNAEIAAFARTYVIPEPSIILVGDAATFSGGLSALASDVRIVAAGDLDLNAAL
ncbi:MAG: insulinase family protein [Candidatus Eremiobacteraeota bacterium]|nr:insulinase family protein [Candidatus Eremiobacteraeota bacterium]